MVDNTFLREIIATADFQPSNLTDQLCRTEQIYRPIQAWHWMMQTLQTPATDEWVREEVATAWKRCLEDHQILNGERKYIAQTKRNENPLERSLILRIFEAVLQTSLPLFVDGTLTSCLTDENGIVIAVFGRPLQNNNAPEYKLFKRYNNWSESRIGNNGLGTALLTSEVIAFSGEEHFLPELHAFTTSGYPLEIRGLGSNLILGFVTSCHVSANYLATLNSLVARDVLQTLNELKYKQTQLPMRQTDCHSPTTLGYDKNVNSTKHPETKDCSCEIPLDKRSPIERLIAKTTRLQARRIPVLVVGESGAGKEHVVRTAFEHGPWRDGPFIALNCASIPRELIESELFGYASGSFTGARREGKPGKFQLADNGVLLLDEIGDMPLDLQSALLRVLENSEFYPIGASKPVKVNVQIFAATNIPIEKAVQEGRFRADLYYRLNGAQIIVPPLRDRDDKWEIILSILKEELLEAGYAHVPWLSPEIAEIFMKHPWPGNVRQLKNVIRTAVNISDDGMITLGDLPDNFLSELSASSGSSVARCGVPTNFQASAIVPERYQGESPPSESSDGTMSMDEWSVRAIVSALKSNNGNLTKAATKLGISRTTLYKKLAQHRIDHHSFSNSRA